MNPGLSVNPGLAARLAVLALAFLSFGLSQELRVLHVANAGVLLDCGGRQVAIDVFFRQGVEGYETVPEALRDAIESARPPYDGIELILATHRHPDHFDPASVARHLRNNPRARFAGTAQTASEVRRLFADRVEEITRPARQAWGNIETRFLRVPHNTPFRETIENTLHLVRFCGATVAVTGDAEVAAADFRDLGLEVEKIDVLVAPWWFFVGRDGRQVVDEIFQPLAGWAVHGDLKNSAGWIADVRSSYRNVRIGFADAPAN